MDRSGAFPQIFRRKITFKDRLTAHTKYTGIMYWLVPWIQDGCA
jgi:hypothetical protein